LIDIFHLTEYVTTLPYKIEIVSVILCNVQIDSGKVRMEEGRHSGLFSFIRRSSLGDKKPQLNAAGSSVQQMTVADESAPMAPPTDGQQTTDGTLLLMLYVSDLRLVFLSNFRHFFV